MIKHFSLSEPVQVSFESSFTTANPNTSSAKPDCCMYVFGRNSYNYHMIGIWNIGDKEWKEVKLNISACMLKQMNGFSLETIKGNGTIKISGFKLEADGKLVTSSHDTQTLQCGKKVTYRFSLPTNLQANNGCIMTIRLTSLSEKAAGIVVVDK